MYASELRPRDLFRPCMDFKMYFGTSRLIFTRDKEAFYGGALTDMLVINCNLLTLEKAF